MLLLLHDVEGVVEFAELMMDQGVLGEALFRQPRAVQPVAMEGPLEEAGLYDSDEKTNRYP